MNRSPLEKASWIAGIVSAVVGVWVLFFPSGQTKEDLPKRQQVAAIDHPEQEIPNSTPNTTAIGSSSTDQNISSNRACPSREVIIALRSQARLLSTYAARDAAYRPLIKDAICLNDLELAAEIVGLASTYRTRDEFYQQVFDAALATGKRDIAERIAGLMSTYSVRDSARQKIMAALRSQSQKVEANTSGTDAVETSHP